MKRATDDAHLAAVLTKLLEEGNYQIKDQRLTIEARTKLTDDELQAIIRLIDPEREADETYDVR